MHSRNKPAMTAQERAHVCMIKEMACICCEAPPPCDAHEIEQGKWFLSVPLCRECHTGYNGLHGTKAAWKVRKLTELGALNMALQRIFDGR